MQRACALLALLLASSAFAQDAVKDRARAMQQRIDTEVASLVAIYQQIHANAELAFQETKTAARLAKELRQVGCEVVEKIGGTGVVGVLKNGDGPVVLIRADMDGLPIVEQTGLAYASQVRTRDKDGLDIGVMHACGHDMNVACLIGTARVLAAIKDQWKGTLLFLGQPAEEIGAGARAMLKDGLLKKVPRPDFALALHCDGRYPHGHVNYRAGQLQANVDSVDIHVFGKGGHGAAPHTTIDPVLIAARIVVDLQTLISRERDPLEPRVITVGALHGGTKHNIIPSEAKLQLTVRTMSDTARKETLEGIARVAKAVAMSARAPEPKIVHNPDDFTPALVNEQELTTRMSTLFKDVLGAERVHERPLSLGGEDFSQFTRAGIRTFYYHLGTADPAKHAESLKPGGTPLASTHSPFYAPVPDPTLRTGVLTMSMAVMDLLTRK
jgi:amidohydrolase